MDISRKKIMFFVMLTYVSTIVFFIIIRVLVKNSINLVGISMVIPIISVIIVEKFIFKESLRSLFNSNNFKINLWLLFAICIPVVMSFIINLINTVYFGKIIVSPKVFLANVITGLSIATISAFVEELAWRGFLFNELRYLGIFKVLLCILVMIILIC
ncbi:hypothetical protein ACJDT4_08910 [Clostridium neuense]|uniref:CPBP family intramembrane metalloprotease n=1 Tax=Clostridium neuense TaxID=1728934 RepID=A0ABW8TDF9_9CLOT